MDFYLSKHLTRMFKLIIVTLFGLWPYPFTGRGVDYHSGPYEVTFTAGTTEPSFNISLIITDDFIFERNENFTITIDPSSLPSNVTVGDPDQVTVTIVDNDG